MVRQERLNPELLYPISLVFRRQSVSSVAGSVWLYVMVQFSVSHVAPRCLGSGGQLILASYVVCNFGDPDKIPLVDA